MVTLYILCHSGTINPEVEGSKSARKKFKSYQVSYFQVDISEVQTPEGKLYLFVAMGRTSKYTFA